MLQAISIHKAENSKHRMAKKVYIDDVDNFKKGEFRTAFHGNTDIAVFNLNGDYYALEDVCTHDGGILTGGKVEDGEVECPRHFARFSIKTGEALTPPAYEDVETYETVVEDGKVYVLV